MSMNDAKADSIDARSTSITTDSHPSLAHRSLQTLRTDLHNLYGTVNQPTVRWVSLRALQVALLYPSRYNLQ